MATCESSGLPASLKTDMVPYDGYSSMKALLLSMLFPMPEPLPATGSLAYDYDASMFSARDCEMGSFRNSKMHSRGLYLLPKTLAEMLNQSISSLV